MIHTHEGVEIDLAHLPPGDPKTYELIRRADTAGVFQIESRAQMASLPRNRPVNFYDLVVQVAIIRPGPIAGNMTNPYLERRQGREAVTYAHPCLKPILERTLGVPLFQEQLLRIAMEAAGFSGGEAEELRRAMGFKRSQERMVVIRTGQLVVQVTGVEVIITAGHGEYRAIVRHAQRPPEGLFGQGLAVHQFHEWLGMGAPRNRPQPRAGAPGEDHWNQDLLLVFFCHQ